MLELGMTMDYGQLVMDNEFSGMMRHVLQGIVVNDETLATDLIKEVGPGGNHLTANLTLKHMRGYQSAPKFIDREMFDNWKANGSRVIKETCDAEARRVLENHKPTPLSEDSARYIREVIDKEEKNLGIS